MKKYLIMIFILAGSAIFAQSNVSVERRYGSWIISLDAGRATKAIQFTYKEKKAIQPFSRVDLGNAAEQYKNLVDEINNRGLWGQQMDPLVKGLKSSVQFPLIVEGGSTLEFPNGTKRTITLTLSDFSGDDIYFFFYSDGKWTAYKVTLEFFPGEKATLAQGAWEGVISYKQKSAVFLNSALGGKLKATLEAMETRDKEFFQGYMGEISKKNWEAFNNKNVDSGISAFKTEILKHFSQEVGSMKIPGHRDVLQLVNLSITEKDFPGLYGPPDKRNPYIFSYLYMIFNNNKPILSQVVADYLPSYPYNFTDYTPLNKDEGAKVAEMALRYLTWAPEYTRPQGGEQINSIDELSSYSSTISTWISNVGISNRSPDNNYLPVGHNLYTKHLSLGGSTIPLTSPFVLNNLGKWGNPLPYVRYGFDMPRTFAWKVREQREARKFLYSKRNGLLSPFNRFGYLGDSLRALDNQGLNENYFEYYVDELTFLDYLNSTPQLRNKWDVSYIRSNLRYKETPPSEADMPLFGALRSDGGENWVPKPFLPGDFGPNKKISSPWGPLGFMKGAGVDSIGIVLGSCAMAGIPMRNYRNITTSQILNDYAKMVPNGSNNLGLDQNGKPKYWSTGEIDWTNLKWTKIDLERNTLLVPDIRLVQPGDLIVDYQAPRNPSEEVYETENVTDMHIGIVVQVPLIYQVSLAPGVLVEAPAGPLDASIFSSRIQLVSIRPGLRNVVLGSWANSVNSFGGFTATPQRYQIRRLLKWNKGTSIAKDNIPQPYELIDTVPHSLKIESAMVSMNGFERFIPNTGEILVLNGIKVRALNRNGGALKLKGINAFIEVLAPKDAYFVPGDDTGSNGNIKNNTGGGLDYYVNDKVGLVDNWLPVRRFKRDPKIIVAERYIKDPDFKPLVDGNFIVQESDDVVIFKKKDGTILEWGIRPQTPGGLTPVRPGDDFFLGFELLTKTVKSYNEVTRFAIYDKKMLWRANLYLVETGENGDDWNNVHSWNAPASPDLKKVGKKEWSETQKAMVWTLVDPPTWWSEAWGYNEWNKRWVEGTTWAGINTLSPGDGTQKGTIPTVHPYVWVDNAEYKERVSYDWKGQDSPFEFNFKMEQQRTLMGQYYAPNGRQFLQPMTSWVNIDTRTLAQLEAFTFDGVSWGGISGYNDSIDKLAFVRGKMNAWKNGTESTFRNTQPPDDNNSPGRPAARTRYWRYVFGHGLAEYEDWYDLPADHGEGNLPSNNVHWLRADQNPENTSPITLAGTSLNIGGNAARPYAPGLSNTYDGKEYYWTTQITTQGVDPQYNGSFASGVDCTGFVMRAAGWLNQGLNGAPSYTWQKTFTALGPRDWVGKRGDGMPGQNPAGANKDTAYAMPAGNGDNNRVVSWKITGRGAAGALVADHYKFLVPGDVYFYFSVGATGNWIGNHITTISSVQSNPDGSVPVGNIQLIESTFSLRADANGNVINPPEHITGRVEKTRSLTDYQGKTNWVLVRLQP